MNKHNKKLILLTGLLLTAPTIQANAPLKYIDASGKERIIGGETNTAQVPQQEAYSNQYTAAPTAHDTTAANQGVQGNTGPAQTDVLYYDAETGEPVLADEIGLEYFTAPMPGSAASTAYHQPPVAAERPQPTQVQAPQEAVYIDAVTGKPLTKEQAQEAMAYNHSVQTGSTYDTATYPAPSGAQNTAKQQNNYAATSAVTPQNAYDQQHNAYTAMPQAQQPAVNMPAAAPKNSGSGYEMYADTNASADQKTATMPAQNAAPQRSRVTTASVVKAVEAGRIDVLSSLQAQGADLRTSDAQGLTYLHRAAAAGHVKMAKYLLRAGLNPNASTSKNWTPLHHAARFGHAEIVAALLAAGADERQVTSDGFSAKRLAMNAKKYKVAALLR